MLSAGGRQFGIMWNYSVRFKVKTLLKQLNRIFALCSSADGSIQGGSTFHHKSLVGVGGDNFYERSRPQGTRLNLSLSLLRTAGCRNFKGGGFRLMSDASVGEMKRKHLQAVKRDRQPGVQFTGGNITMRRRNAERVSRLLACGITFFVARGRPQNSDGSAVPVISLCAQWRFVARSKEVVCLGSRPGLRYDISWQRWRRREQWSLRPAFFFLTLKSQPKFIPQK